MMSLVDKALLEQSTAIYFQETKDVSKLCAKKRG